MFIHCIFVGFNREFKGKGYGSLLIDECTKEAKDVYMLGVAVVIRKGAFMAKKDSFAPKPRDVGIGFFHVSRLKSICRELLKKRCGKKFYTQKNFFEGRLK